MGTLGLIAAAAALLGRTALPVPPDDAGKNQQNQDGCQNEPSAGPGLGKLRRSNWGRFLERFYRLVHEPAIGWVFWAVAAISRNLSFGLPPRSSGHHI
jgi:hypothetical protein